MPFEPGHIKYGGRKIGTPNKIDRDLSNALAEYYEKHPDCDRPQIALAKMINDMSIDPAVRAAAAKAMLPYLYKRQPQSVEVSGPDGDTLTLRTLIEEARNGGSTGDDKEKA